MDTNYTSPVNFGNDDDLENIIRINNSNEAENADDDYDFDYDPNEQYYL